MSRDLPLEVTMSDAGAELSVRDVAMAPGTACSPHFLVDLHTALSAMRRGDFSKRLSPGHEGIGARIAEDFNALADANSSLLKQLVDVGQVVGRDGRTRRRVRMAASGGAWSEMEDAVNGLIDDLLWPTGEVTRVISAVAQGD